MNLPIVLILYRLRQRACNLSRRNNYDEQSWQSNHYIDFPDYAEDELLAIAKLMLAEQNYRFSPDAEAAFVSYLEKRMTMSHFANARSVRNALDRARLRQANRLFVDANKRLTKIDLMTLQPEDILASRVFIEDEDEEENT